jgi:hypothetical protein
MAPDLTPTDADDEPKHYIHLLSDTESFELGFVRGVQAALAVVDQGGRAAAQIRALLESEA